MTEPIFKVNYLTDYIPVKAGLSLSAATLSGLCAQFPLVCLLVGGIHESVKALILLMVLDLITGLLAAYAQRERINSRRFGMGGLRKLVVLFIVAGAQYALDPAFGTGNVIFTGATYWFIATEFISLYENAERMGVPMPPFLKAAVAALLRKASEPVQALLEAPKPAVVQSAPENKENVDA